MELTTLLESIAGLIVLLALLMYMLFLNRREKKTQLHNIQLEPRVVADPKEVFVDMPTLKKRLRNKTASREELANTVALILKFHGEIASKNGIYASAAFDDYLEIIVVLCRHANTSKELILHFDKELSRRNPDYKSDIDHALTQGLNSRGI